MDIGTDFERRMLVESAERYLTENRDSWLRTERNTPEAFAGWWRDCVDLGWLLTCVPAERDGAGLNTTAAAALVEAAGAVLLPLPVAPGVAVAALQAQADWPENAQAMLLPWLSGEALIGVIHGDVARYAVNGHALHLECRDGELALTMLGTSPVGYGVDPLLPVAKPEKEINKLVLPCSEQTWLQYQRRLRALTLAEMLGAACGALKVAVDYACERTQFGRPIGSYQAVKHPLANLRMATDDARLALHDACVAIDSGAPDCSARLLMAELLVQEAAHATVEQAIQTHGALGFTWECPVHFHFKRVKHIGAVLRQEHDSAAILEQLWAQAA